MILDRGRKRQERPNIRFFQQYSLKLLFFVLFTLSLFFITNHYKKTTYFPIREVAIMGAQHIDHETIEHLITPLVSKGFFSVDSSEIKDRILQSPWVAHVNVQLVWPQQMIIKITEKLPIARWNDEGLLSVQGELFKPSEMDSLSDLPNFVGPMGQQAQMLSYYKKINNLLIPLNTKISRLEYNPLSLWKITLANGIKVTIGHKDCLTRLDHFVKLYPKIVGDRADEVEYIDLRYSNGMSVKWKVA